MSDPNPKDLIRLKDLPHHLPKSRSGRHVDFSVVYRWATRGLRGGTIKLRTWKLGGTCYSTPGAVTEFLEHCTNPNATPSTRSPRAREKAIRDAEAELAAAGI